MDPEAVRKLEAERRRGLGEALHPDRCPKLTLHGVAFAIPPRRRCVVPVFAPDGVKIQTRDGVDFPEPSRLVELADVAEQEPCPECGQPRSVSLAVTVEHNAEFLRTAFSLAGKLLDRQYDLSAERKADLLKFDAGRLPAWIPELLAWCTQ